MYYEKASCPNNPHFFVIEVSIWNLRGAAALSPNISMNNLANTQEERKLYTGAQNEKSLMQFA